MLIGVTFSCLYPCVLSNCVATLLSVYLSLLHSHFHWFACFSCWVFVSFSFTLLNFYTCLASLQKRWQVWSTVNNLSFYAIKCGELNIIPHVEMIMNRVNTYKQRRSTTIAANFQSLAACSSLSSSSNLLLMTFIWEEMFFNSMQAFCMHLFISPMTRAESFECYLMSQIVLRSESESYWGWIL